ncbi:hypothetical protein BDV39DRAFT_210507 [Aspergillus sergii]|uniref:NACHT domain-containing protein n=1 Tax=Aspergillus sergii TaxID=1034303 RepID=A0A5N6WLC1_9EURO|nr:hypothetical protein BDV39DRAFT_210507 [Aspergillus sergii]
MSAAAQYYDVSVVAVHGLNPKNKSNHAERTWESNGKLWLRDFLPNQLPRARIMLFGYNSNVSIESSSAGVREQARNLLIQLGLERKTCEYRPILFIAHSLGGIVVKESLVQARLGISYETIGASTIGIAFFGTPHQGSRLAPIGDVFAKIVRAILRHPRNTFMNALKSDDLYAREISSNFQQLFEKYRYLNFCETLPLKNFGLIVEMRSATLGLPDSRETVVALDADHESICRFASEDDDDYRRVSSLIVELAASVTEPSLRSFSTSGSTYVAEKANATFFILPYSRNPGFVGRGPILESLGVCLASFGLLHNRIALYGLGGVGKSHIAIEFAYRFTTEHPEASVFWVHASSIDRFKQGYCDILDACGVLPEVDNRDSDRPMRVREWLEKQHHKWLLIIDNADEASLLTSEGNIKGGKLGTATQAHKHLSILDYLPDCSHGSIIITTRDRVAGVRFTKSCAHNLIEVVSMTEAESASLIKSAATEQCPEDSEVDELAEILENLPLAIVQAMSFIQENALTLGEYIELYNDSDDTRMDLLCEPFETLGRDTEVPNALATTLMVSINHIKERDTTAIGVLSLLAFFDHYHIPKSLLQKQLKKALDLVKTLGTLKAFSLITPGRDKDSFSLHRLVQLVIRKWLIIEDNFEEKAIQAMDILAEAFPDANFENWSICGVYLPHAQSTLRFISELHGEDLKKRRLYLQEGIAYYLWSQGRCNEAEALDILILEEKKQCFGRDHPETLESMASLASTYQNQGRWSEAEALDMYIVETRKKLLGPRHNLTLTSMANLASAYEYLGRLQEAETLRVEVLEERKSNFGEEHDSTIDAMASLGALYLDLGKMESAEVLIRRSWSWRRKNYGSAHQVTWLSAGAMAQLYRAQGEFQKAEDLSIETIRTIESALGPNHSLCLQSKSNLAGIYTEIGEWDKAEGLLIQVIEEAGKQESAPYDMLARKQRLATIYWNKGLVRESETLERELFKESIQKLGQRHRLTLKCKYSVAMILKRHGREAEAIQLLVETTNDEEQVLGPFNENTLTSIGTLSEWCGADKAISMLLEAQEARDKYSHVTAAWESILNLLQQMELG